MLNIYINIINLIKDNFIISLFYIYTKVEYIEIIINYFKLLIYSLLKIVSLFRVRGTNKEVIYLYNNNNIFSNKYILVIFKNIKTKILNKGIR